MSEEDEILYALSQHPFEVTESDEEYALLERLVSEGYVQKTTGGRTKDGETYWTYNLSDRELRHLGRA